MSSKPAMHFASVVSLSYFPQLYALARSIVDTHPGSTIDVLVVDGSKVNLEFFEEKIPNLRCTSPEHLELDGLAKLRSYYDTFELCNALRPTWLKYLLRENSFNHVIYLDADIFVLDRMNLTDLIAERAFGFCPHVLSPYPDDGKVPSNFSLRVYGPYNSGLLAFSSQKKSIEALSFLERVLQSQCFNSPPHCFVDQTWLPFVTTLYHEAFHFVRHPGYNIGYWNLHERKLGLDVGRVLSNGLKAKCIHFSGATESQLSRWTDREAVNSNEIANQLYSKYRGLMSEFLGMKNNPYLALTVEKSRPDRNAFLRYFDVPRHLLPFEST